MAPTTTAAPILAIDLSKDQSVTCVADTAHHRGQSAARQPFLESVVLLLGTVWGFG